LPILESLQDDKSQEFVQYDALKDFLKKYDAEHIMDIIVVEND
jgi:hypothetical protein